MQSKNSYEFADIFLNQIIEEIVDFKNKNNDIEKKLLASLGAAFKKDEIDNIKNKDGKFLKEEIIKKFNNKREERSKNLGDDKSKEIERRIFLQLIDQNWKLHIQYLEQLRQVIGLRSYGQRDPLIEYKKEAFNLFEDLLNNLRNQFISLLLNIKIVSNSEDQEKKPIMSENSKCLIVIKKGEKISRNEVCPATNKKYKNCCGSL